MEERSVADGGESRDLDGAISRSQFMDIAAAEVARARRYRNPLSCLVIDVDAFNSPGEQRDQPAGDRVLQHFVSVCKATLRAPDYIGRIGVNEFAIMLPETQLLSALGVAERILANLAASTEDSSKQHLATLISIGVVEYADQNSSLGQLLEAAAAAMTDAKRNGCNQAVCYLDDLQLSSVAATVN